MANLQFFETCEIDELASPAEKTALTLQSPALEFFTDFTVTTPLVVEDSMTALAVKELMLKTHVRLKIVVDSNKKFMGIIAADDLIDRKIVQKVSEGMVREEISLKEFMKPKQKLRALDYNQVARASIGDVIKVLKQWGEQHCLVLDRENHVIRGIFSASDLSRKLHLPIDIQDRSDFYRVFAVTH